MKYIVGLLVIAVLGLGAFVVTRPSQVPFGAAGPDQYAFANFFGGMSVGQGIIASSTSASQTLSGSEFLNADTLDYTVNVGSVTLTLAASTTPICSSLGIGQRRNIFIRNATTTAASTITLAGGTGIKLKIASTTILAGNTDGSNMAKIELVRKANRDCDALFTQFN